MNLKPCPENPQASSTRGAAGCGPTTKCSSGVRVYQQAASRTCRSPRPGQQLGQRPGHLLDGPRVGRPHRREVHRRLHVAGARPATARRTSRCRRRGPRSRPAAGRAGSRRPTAARTSAAPGAPPSRRPPRMRSDHEVLVRGEGVPGSGPPGCADRPGPGTARPASRPPPRPSTSRPAGRSRSAPPPSRHPCCPATVRRTSRCRRARSQIQTGSRRAENRRPTAVRTSAEPGAPPAAAGRAQQSWALAACLSRLRIASATP